MFNNSDNNSSNVSNTNTGNDAAGVNAGAVSEPQDLPRPAEAASGLPTLSDDLNAAADRLAASELLVPVFYDERRRRWPWVRRAFVTLLALSLLAGFVLALSIFVLPLMPHNPLPRAARAPEYGNQEPTLTQYQRHLSEFIHGPTPAHPLTHPQRRQLGVKFARDKQRLALLDSKRQRDEAEARRKAVAFLQSWPARAGLERGNPAGVTPFGVPFGQGTGNREQGTKNAAAGSPRMAHTAVLPLAPVVAAFYVNWEETSWASAQRNMEHLTHFIPEWLHLKQGGADALSSDPKILPFLDARDDKDKTEVPNLAHRNNVPILALLNNFTRPKNQEEGEGSWDTNAVHAIVSDAVARQNVALRLKTWLTVNNLQGVNIDFEQVAPQDRNNLTLFMQALYETLHPVGLLVTQDVEMEGEGEDTRALAQWNDWIVPMFYDQHEAGSEPGPVAGLDWTRQHLASLLKGIPPQKIVMGVDQEGYDWIAGQKGADSLRYQSAVVAAKESYDGRGLDGVIRLDPVSLNPTFTYEDQETGGTGSTRRDAHTVWMLDAVSAYNQLRDAQSHHLRGAALWMLGAEDPSLWTFYDRSAWNTDWQKIIAGGALDTISYGGTGEIDFTAEGELLQPVADPSNGRRDITLDPKTGLITAESYQSRPVPNTATRELLIPSSYVVRRYGSRVGNPDKQIVLTFDDGPDPVYTPQILDTLKQYHVPAVFFVVGKQAEAFPDLVRRMWDEGHEIGNHTWDHKDMAQLSPEFQRLELSSTERVIQALTGHSTTLWRPPYGNDVEPATGAEVRPLDLAAQMNYITVGQKIDPQDWNIFKPVPNRPDTKQLKTPQDIINGVLTEKEQGSIVLLHDAGGDRSRTVAALPGLIQQLRAQGYTFVSVAQLSGIKPVQGDIRFRLMPAVTGKDIYLVGSDRLTFEAAYIFQRVLSTLFALSIVLGVSRIFLFVGLALIQRGREKRRVFPIGYTPSVSVIIAAYNEETVVARTINALLLGGYPNLQIIVVDDGSKDDTSGVVAREFGDNPLIQLIRKPNGGKASALNRGLMVATGDIMVSLDADTLFAPDTIAKLARHFADPNVGAVSGNVRVGNATNIWTIWQSLEYTTSQNFDRRGYDLLNCITVVPGAVGAMRRKAVAAVGGYTHDTLAEDTDLTWKLRRSGWRIVNDNTAMAYTEAPESLKNLAKQRFRWAFGTLQCLWKHRAALWNDGAFGWIALPSLWVYQILFPAVSPFMDVGMVYALLNRNFAAFGWYFLAMFGIEFVAAFMALRMDKGNLKLLPWLFLQRFVYRQLMYYVVLRALWTALRGSAVGWNKFERTGTARIEPKTV